MDSFCIKPDGLVLLIYSMQKISDCCTFWITQYSCLMITVCGIEDQHIIYFVAVIVSVDTTHTLDNIDFHFKYLSGEQVWL